MTLRRWTTVVPFVVDAALLLVTWFLAFWFRFNLDVPPEYVWLAVQGGGAMVLVYSAVALLMGVHKRLWQYTGLHEIRLLAMAVLLGAGLTAAVVLMLRLPQFPRSVLVMHPLLAVLFLAGARAGWRYAIERDQASRSAGAPLLIAGTLDECRRALDILRNQPEWAPEGILTPPGQELSGHVLQGVPVLGDWAALPHQVAARNINALLWAGAADGMHDQAMLLQASSLGLNVLALPKADDWLRSDSRPVRKIALEDLLGRATVDLDVHGLADLVSGHTVLVTGAGGSIGSELCRQLARLGVARLVCVDVSEFAMYQLDQELSSLYRQMKTLLYTANVREYDRLLSIALLHRPTVVLHAAAYKHVPLMEEHNGIEAIRTNVLGTLHAARVAGECGARRFVLVSTDKAVNPTNVMGATKRLAERVVQTVAPQYPETGYVAVRFGNVLGSSGSVVPLFTAQIAKGGPVTVTHPDVVRYFMTIPEAAQLVLQAGLVGRSGQIFVLEMGSSVRILDLARMMIQLSGHTEQQIPIVFCGLRPGEKLFEELLADDETTVPSGHAKLRVSASSGVASLDLAALQAWLAEYGTQASDANLRQWLLSWVAEYQPRAGN
jgi:FlaA1/EpsC-like NDP-sugar epimerase